MAAVVGQQRVETAGRGSPSVPARPRRHHHGIEKKQDDGMKNEGIRIPSGQIGLLTRRKRLEKLGEVLLDFFGTGLRFPAAVQIP
jgi:hypothetical protein